MNPNPSASNRLYGMMQHLLANYADQEVPDPAELRDVVDKQDALDAVVQLAAFLDSNSQAGNISVNDAEFMASMLMIIREFVQPLPFGSVLRNGVETDGVTSDLQEIVDALRQAREAEDRRG
ncbi:hypothetical protein ABZ686_02435 [Streptomyces sp. NPDC006992]|uniref:hypothetical protein n=1 Tax=Streptomyces sp. NPDC006992 TaxID=3155601 RepID=UPI0033F32F3B